MDTLRLRLEERLDRLRRTAPVQQLARTRVGRALIEHIGQIGQLGQTGRQAAPLDAEKLQQLLRAQEDLEATERYLKMHRDRSLWPSFADMSEDIDDPLRPPLDRQVVDETKLSARQLFWRKNGYLLLENLIPHDLIDAYVEVRKQWPKSGGYACPTPYMHIPQILDLSLHPPLVKAMEELLGGEMILHLNLTGWVSTERDWHQDDYLNPPVINGWYIASWMALDDIHPDCGPFQFVPGSHRWSTLRRERVRYFLPPLYARSAGQQHDYGHWAEWSQDFVAHACERKIAESGLPIEQLLAKKGDVLLWHACLLHRGSPPRVPGMPRMALISHYSEIEHRVDFDRSRQLTHKTGGKYQDFGIPLY